MATSRKGLANEQAIPPAAPPLTPYSPSFTGRDTPAPAQIDPLLHTKSGSVPRLIGGSIRALIEIDEEKMEVVRYIFRKVAEGASLASVKRALEAEGIPTPSGGTRWSRSTLREMVKRDA